MKKSATCNPRKKKSKTIDEKMTPQQFQFHASKVIASKERDSYFCILCESSLKGKTTIRSHIQNQTLNGDSGYRCHVCNEQFQWKGFLNRHVKQHFIENYVETDIKSNVSCTLITAAFFHAVLFTFQFLLEASKE